MRKPRRSPPQERGRAMAEALAALAKRRAFASITDPVAWQRAVRADGTAYLTAIPGIKESIVKGLRTPVKKCAKELRW